MVLTGHVVLVALVKLEDPEDRYAMSVFRGVARNLSSNVYTLHLPRCFDVFANMLFEKLGCAVRAVDHEKCASFFPNLCTTSRFKRRTNATSLQAIALISMMKAALTICDCVHFSLTGPYPSRAIRYSIT